MARTNPESTIRYPLDRILGVDSNVRVLRVLARHGGLLSSSDISHRARLSKSSTRLGLIGLEAAGIVQAEGSGYNRLYRLNVRHDLSSAIEALFTAEDRRFTAILDAVRNGPGDQARHVESLWVYGSVARGDDHFDSDLDVGVVADAVHLKAVVEAIRAGLVIPSERLAFSPSVVGLDLDDVRRLSRDDDPWWSNVVRDATVLAGRRPEELSRAPGFAFSG
ncbi:putative nucleotidyltransferase/DNA-binding transcriptional ArsR family regulator [Rhizobium sp. BK650]|uniref:helix-turn-helix domain-containing protein n=1 Tax=Rhizobium sp. BK650 TaxID=2586990 RepID=UPI00161AE66F|nr:helix-turn-helix domain-containing protein [Rhizobium sp. BK650]MBB3656645.1 putative nucleotidyltransferase/DNA-binding transcriptional ArsR family regulator [Rhizobium sp. BK650]